MTEGEVAALLAAHPAWSVDAEGHLTRTWALPDFAAALALANRIGALADQLDHHPELAIGWGRLRATVWSHDARGLTARDARLVASADELCG
ncbi:MAG: 4a-hydroxytetrahydrobiopterin dehydratase [Deltaproteobacteria bacterium]|nr:4a-hydroxytetrahydrobiopterin dehydratase [Deltaproteobacteria bacterium]